jgi:HlyD family secretion protein
MRTALMLLIVLTVAGCGARDEAGVLRASGMVEVTEVRLTARTAGEIEVRVREGARVMAGDTVAAVNQDILRLQLEGSRAGVAAAAARLDLLRAGARSEDIAAARARLRQAEAELALATEQVERLRSLAGAGSAMQSQLDDAEARYRIVQAAHEAGAAELHKIERLARPEELRQAAALLEQARGAEALIERQLRDVHVVAPFGGVVTRRAAESGETVAPGMPVMTLADLSTVFLRVYLTERELAGIRLGMPVEVQPGGDKARPLPGHVSFISSEAEFTPRNVQTREDRMKLVYAVRVEVANETGVLKPGMYADAVFRSESGGR